MNYRLRAAIAARRTRSAPLYPAGAKRTTFFRRRRFDGFGDAACTEHAGPISGAALADHGGTSYAAAVNGGSPIGNNFERSSTGGFLVCVLFIRTLTFALTLDPREERMR